MKTTLDKKLKKLPTKSGDNRRSNGTFGPGNCANPEGRPEGSFSLLSLLKAELQKCPPEYKKDKKTYADLIIKRMLEEAIEKGDQQQIRLIWNYIEGMPKESHDITSGGKPIPIYGGLSRNNSNKEDISVIQEDKSG